MQQQHNWKATLAGSLAPVGLMLLGYFGFEHVTVGEIWIAIASQMIGFFAK